MRFIGLIVTCVLTVAIAPAWASVPDSLQVSCDEATAVPSSKTTMLHALTTRSTTIANTSRGVGLS